MIKYITRSRFNKLKNINIWEWESKPDKKLIVVDDTNKKDKERIESIPLEKLSFKDLYKFPFRQAIFGTWVYDDNSNFIFQFQFENENTRKQVIDILNGDFIPKKKKNFIFKDGIISIDDKQFIMIRGWGNLTGIGGYNIDGEYAAKIQDTLGEYIVEKLNGSVTDKAEDFTNRNL